MARAQDFISSINTAIASDLASPSSRIHAFFANNISGGWEAWLQVEAARQIIADGKAADFQRECSFPAPGGVGVMGGMKCDLVMQPARGQQIFIELKTQRNAAYARHVRDFTDDVDKIRGLGPAWNATYPAIAMVCMQANQAAFQAIFTALNRTDCDLWVRQADNSFKAGKLSQAVTTGWANQFAIVAYSNS
ncbi:MAG: hypothetical protein GW859_05220 [Sphingomonadales bacterium]|nr:hypothetical protein [Sphingomonadales bacterium]